jgi:hypothetical protein
MATRKRKLTESAFRKIVKREIPKVVIEMVKDGTLNLRKKRHLKIVERHLSDDKIKELKKLTKEERRRAKRREAARARRKEIDIDGDGDDDFDEEDLEEIDIDGDGDDDFDEEDMEEIEVDGDDEEDLDETMKDGESVMEWYARLRSAGPLNENAKQIDDYRSSIVDHFKKN